jgi:hypothetical protein
MIRSGLGDEKLKQMVEEGMKEEELRTRISFK